MFQNIAYTENFYIQNDCQPPSSLLTSQTDSFYFAKDRSGIFVCVDQSLLKHFHMQGSSAILGKTDFHIQRHDLAEKHREDESCRDCHLKIDPWGVVFENYDAVGIFNPKADAATQLLDGTDLNGVAELKSYLLKSKKDALTRSVIKHLLSYSLGRELSYMDNEDITDLVKQVQGQNYGFQDLVKNIIKHDIFSRK